MSNSAAEERGHYWWPDVRSVDGVALGEACQLGQTLSNLSTLQSPAQTVFAPFVPFRCGGALHVGWVSKGLFGLRLNHAQSWIGS